MLAQDYLTIRLVRLNSSEEWQGKPDGVSFVFPKGGSGKYRCGPTVQPLVAGDVLVANGGGGGKIGVANGGEMVFWCFSLALEHLYPLFAAKEICLLQNVVEGLKPLKLYAASSVLARECHRLVGEVPPQFSLDHRSQLLRVATVILGDEFKTAQRQRVGFVRPEEHLVQVFENLAADELLSLSVEELADKFGCSRRHLNRLFHQHFGFSVGALRMEMRLLKAVSLLRDPDIKIINVAEQCGFNHLGLFNTCFKRRFGSSPGQWRKLASPPADRPGGETTGGLPCPLHSKGLCPWSPKTAGLAPTSQAAPAVSRTPKPGQAKLLISISAVDEGLGHPALASQQKTRGDLLSPSHARISP